MAPFFKCLQHRRKKEIAPESSVEISEYELACHRLPSAILQTQLEHLHGINTKRHRSEATIDVAHAQFKHSHPLVGCGNVCYCTVRRPRLDPTGFLAFICSWVTYPSSLICDSTSALDSSKGVPILLTPESLRDF
jgi:hypothetical protein